jgi:hypothetical protein
MPSQIFISDSLRESLKGASHLCKWIDFRSAGILPASERSIMLQKWNTPESKLPDAKTLCSDRYKMYYCLISCFTERCISCNSGDELFPRSAATQSEEIPKSMPIPGLTH